MSGSLGKSENTSSQQFGQDVWQPQGDALAQMYGAASGLFGKGAGDYGQQMSQGRNYSNQAMGMMMDPWQAQMGGGAYGGIDATGMVYDAQQQLANPTTYTQDIYGDIMLGEGNDYVDALTGTLTTQAEETLGMNLGALDQRAAAAGMSGGSRHGVATANIAEDINQNLQSELATMGYETFDQDLQQKLDIAQMADTNALASAQTNAMMAQNMMAGQQGAMSGGLGYGNMMTGYGMQQQMMPWQMMGAYGGLLGAPTILGSGSGSASGKGFSTAGGM